MEVYRFERDYHRYLVDFKAVENERKWSTSSIRIAWEIYCKSKIKPSTGWQALWNISRSRCEKLNKSYPTIVLGTVKKVNFEKLQAEFVVSDANGSGIEVPQMVPFEALWPTKVQEDEDVDAYKVAHCIDLFRFFYRHIWMPWDYEASPEEDWFGTYFKKRLDFWKNSYRGMEPEKFERYKAIMTEARCIQAKLRADRADQLKVMEKYGKEMRLKAIAAEFENSLVNSSDWYEEYRKCEKMKTGPVHCIVSWDTFRRLKSTLHGDHIQTLPNLQKCLELELDTPSKNIYLPAGVERIHQQPGRPLSTTGTLKAVLNDSTKVLSDELNPTTDAIIESSKEATVLLTFITDYTVENLKFDCRKVRTGLWIRSGSVTLKNCVLLGDIDSPSGIGIMVSAGAMVRLENCQIHKFAVGIHCEPLGKATVENNTIRDCDVDMQSTDGRSAAEQIVQENQFSEESVKLRNADGGN